MPAFYLLGIIALACQYIVDRLTLCYFYRLPPMYSEVLTLETLDILKYVPPITLTMLFWQFTNKQMFDNLVDPIENIDEVKLSHHLPWKVEWDSLETFQKALLITVCLLIFNIIVVDTIEYIQEQQKKYNKDSLNKNDEHMPNFYDTLREQDIKDYIRDENDFKEIGYEHMGED